MALQTTTCFTKGTKIRLANNKTKNVEDITYDDLLLVYNFETGKIDYQYPLVVGQSGLTGNYTIITLSDDSTITITGTHDIYNPQTHKFDQYGVKGINNTNLLTDDNYVYKYNASTKKLKKVKVSTVEMFFEQNVEMYTLITGGTITSFGNDVLCGIGYLNMVPITADNKFDNFEFIKTQAVSYDYMKQKYGNNIPEQYYMDGMLMNYAPKLLPNIGTEEVLAGVTPLMLSNQPMNKDGQKLCRVTIQEGDEIVVNYQVPVNTYIQLPQFKNSNYIKWYVVGQYKDLDPEDRLQITYPLYIRAK